MDKSPGTGTALITGASSGIGAIYADRLARRGFDLVLIARDRSRLESLAERLRHETGVAVEILPADLTEKADLARIEQRLRADETIALLVNNAGMATTSALLGADLDQLEMLIKLNVLAPTRLSGAAADGFAARKRGAIINIASVLALAPELYGGTYSGSKAFILNFTLSLYQELGPHGIRVQAVLPGATRTEIWERSGTPIEHLPPEILMDAGEMVDAALVGFDRGEVVTIPSLPDAADWTAYNAARLALGPNLSRNHPAPRYLSPDAAPVPIAPVYLEDLKPNQTFTSGSLTVDETAIKAFAAKFDPQAFHLDASAAQKTLFGGLAASGWHTAALTMRLLVTGGAPIAGGVVGAGGEITWPKPTRPGDTLTVESEVLEVVPSQSKPDRGIVTLRSTTRNQSGQAVQVSTMKLVVPRRSAEAR
jgi:short-subunit dehydrogenase/acyl dehydratase